MKKTQITNHKSQINPNFQFSKLSKFISNLVLGIWNLFVIWCLVFGIFFAIKPQSVSAQSLNYPIEELGGCRDANECSFYCQIPKNSPACWSYNKYIINKNILGEETVNITYPINELGACQSAEKCFLYCAQPQNQALCLDFAKKNRLVKETNDSSNIPPPEVLTAAVQELGCSNQETCMALCNDQNNFEKCLNFGEKHKLKKPSDSKDSGPPQAVMLKAKSELGCGDEISCMNFCNKPENQEKCFEFAKKHELLEKKEIAKHDEYLQKREELLTEVKKELGCDSPQTCQLFCQNRENIGKCASIASKIGLTPPPQNNIQSEPSKKVISNPINPGQSGPGGCANEKECQEYCEKNPNDCKGFTQNYSQNSPSTSTTGNTTSNITQRNKPVTKEGDYLGPGGCKTEKECKAYCEKHPNDCPGFPKPSSAQPPKVSPTPVKSAPAKTQKPTPTPNKKPNVQPASSGPSESFSESLSQPLPLLTLPPLEP